jgi:hypothetical protein
MKKTLRDELAMCLESSLIPIIKNETTVNFVAEKLGLEYDLKDPFKMIEFTFKYQSIMRYQFADEMLKVRKQKKQLGCSCSPEETCGETSIMCCNNCGKPTEVFWTN